MPTLLVFEGPYYSQGDEDAFFEWLTSIPGIGKVVGTPDGLLVTLRRATLSAPALRELVAIHWRYELPMRDLARFKDNRNAAWFADPGKYWYEAVFGPNAVPASVESRLAALRSQGASPVAAIKAIRSEYGMALKEAKRRLSISPAWAAVASANAQLQREAVAIATSAARAASAA